MNKTEIRSIIQKKTLGLVFVLGAASLAFSQQKAPVTGKVTDADNQSVAYASVTFSNKANKAFSDATLTDDQGNYTLDLAPGNYDITIEAIDYKKTTLSNRQLPIQGGLNLKIERDATASPGVQTKDIQGVVITATSKPMKVEIDKKTYDVKSDLTAIGGNLQDVLQNVPSVSVDPDGTVTMRGSSNVKFLVNGKPSALLGIDDGANALQSIPADQIDRIEVITNPSSKYDASGTAGILNIILKKNNKTGFNGSVVGSLGYLPRTSLNANLNWRKGKMSWFANGGGGYMENKGTNWSDTRFDQPNQDGNTRIYQDTGGKNYGKNYNGSLGFVYDFTDKTSVNASGTIRSFNMEQHQPINYTYYPSAGGVYYGVRNSDGLNTNIGYQGDFGIDHKFDDKGQNIVLALSLQKNNSDGNTITAQSTRNVFQLSDITSQKTNTKSLVGKADYELPTGEAGTLNAGYKIDNNQNDYAFQVLEQKAGMAASQLDRYTNTTAYKELIQALYVQYKNKIGNFGYQVGLRDELSKINIDYANLTGIDNKKIEKNYNGIFPTVFLSYNFSKDNQLMLNYSRRIDRPRSMFLVPFMSYSDNQNVFRGNPDLNPAYIDSFEFGYNISKRKFSINPTLYFRKENDDVKMTVAYLYDDYLKKDVFNTMPQNLGYDQRIGLDINYTYDPFSWLKLMGEADVYRYKTTGDYYYSYPDPANPSKNIDKHISYDGAGTSTRLRLSSTFKIDKTFSVQLMGNYRGAQKEGANDQKPMYFINLGGSKQIWKGDGTIAFNVQDLFNTRSRHMTTYGEGFSREMYMQWQPQQFSVSLTYRFKQGAKIDPPKRRPANSDQGGGEDQMPPM